MEHVYRLGADSTARQARSPWSVGCSLLLGLVAGCGGGDAAVPQVPRPPMQVPGPQPGPGPRPGPGPIAEVDPPRCADAALEGIEQRVFVTAQGSSTAGCGSSSAKACGSIELGIEACLPKGAGCAVLVRWGRYELSRPLVLADGVHLIGSCRFDGEADAKYRSTLVGAKGQEAVLAQSIVSPTRFEGFVVLGGRAAGSGKPSIAMRLNSSTGLTMRRVQIVAGPGGDGDAGGNAQPAADGADAGLGVVRMGGMPGCLTGYGGAGGGTNQGAPCTILAATAGQKSGTASGGSAGASGGNGFSCDGRSSDTPSDGGRGVVGTGGACGAVAAVASSDSMGNLDETRGWTGSRGGDGSAGQSGGGGGGGGRGGACSDGVTHWYGGDGGGGGGGACGGQAGLGGSQGGASIALVLSHSTLSTDLTSVVAATGGQGGRGGDGADGGAGGAGKAGSAVNQVLFWANKCPASGARGGDGGAGGGSGGGAGGNGGPSVGVALLGNSTPPTGLSANYLGTAGAPGDAGHSGSAGLWETDNLIGEGEAFTPRTTGWVRFGVPGSWVYKWATRLSTLMCSSATFGADPAPHAPKRCQVKRVGLAVANDDENFTVSGPTEVRYGAGYDTDLFKVVEGTVSCSPATFGGDPARGTAKTCSVLPCRAREPLPARAGASARVVDFSRAHDAMLFAGQPLTVDQQLASPSGNFTLQLSRDGTVGILERGTAQPVWTGGVRNPATRELIVTPAGALVLRDQFGLVVATVADTRRPGAYLRLDEDTVGARLLLVDGTDILWSAP